MLSGVNLGMIWKYSAEVATRVGAASPGALRMMEKTGLLSNFGVGLGRSICPCRVAFAQSPASQAR